MDKAARKQAMMDKRAAYRAKMRAQRDAVNARRAAKGLKPHAYNPVSLERGMKSGGDVKKMQVGGDIDARRAANAAKRKANFEASMARQKAARNERMANLAKPGQERMAGYRAASARLKDATAASRARRGMKSGGDVKKYSGGGALYRKSADGIATKGKTRGMEVRMAKGGKC